MAKRFFLILFCVLAFAPAFAVAQDSPPCMMGRKHVLDVNNQQVIAWNAITHERFKKRAHIIGIITHIYDEERESRHPGTKHSVFRVKIGPEEEDTIQLIYNLSHGALPPLKEGMSIEACGEYISSKSRKRDTHPAMKKPAIHLLHVDERRWRSGFLKIEDTVYGLH